jgi:3-hydroxyacyl-CoA dehydrogenase
MIIKKAAVIGAGTMGSGIAAHLANAGVPCVLLDIVPPGDGGKGPGARSRLAAGAIERCLSSRPPAFMETGESTLVEAGNLEDDLERLRDCDWVVEAVTENLDVKRSLYRKIAPYLREGAIFSSNTSGLSLELLTDGLDEGLRRRFIITHFFNPPRYMYLLEVVPGQASPETLAAFERFADVRLGKGIVRAKDTPNFIANRIGVFAMATSCRLLVEEALTIEEVDEVTGPPMGRPKTATFRLHDLVGIDVALMVMDNVRALVPGDESRDLLAPPDFLRRMVKEGKLGRKAGSGFYKKEKDEIVVLDLETFQYRPVRPVSFDSLAAARKAKGVGERIKALIGGSDKAARYAWRLLSETLLYSARRVPEIADDVVSVDRALRWGFSWELGPFEMWDAIGVAESVERMQREGKEIPPLVERLLSSGGRSFYGHVGGGGEKRRSYFDLRSGKQAPVPERPGLVLLDDLRDRSKPLRSNAWASVWDIGSGVLCVEFHSKMNTISGDTLATIRQAIDDADRGHYEGVVVGNQAANFSAGANLVDLLAAAREKRWDAISGMIREFHKTAIAMRYSPKPVVVAVHGLTLGGGCELALAGTRVQAAAETNLGLVELGVGLIPAGGGTRELACRASEAVPPQVGADFFPFLRAYFEIVGQAKVSQSGADARAMGYLREADRISMNKDRVLADARATVLWLAEGGYRPPRRRREVRVAGRPGFAELKVMIRQYQAAGYLTDHDVHVAKKFACALCGGEVDQEYPVTEEYLLDLELEAFLSLLGEEKTLERIAHTLKTGKPLKN